MTTETELEPKPAEAKTTKIEDVIERYVQLRDLKAQRKALFDAEMAKVDEGMERLERFMLEYLTKAGLSSVGTGALTAYTASVTSVTTADKQCFLEYVRANEQWHLLDVRPAKTAIVEFRNEHDDLPPGVNWREEKVVRIRRS